MGPDVGFQIQAEQGIDHRLASGTTSERRASTASRPRFRRTSCQWTGLLAYTFVGALSGKRLAQGPRHRGSASRRFDCPEFFTATTEVRIDGPQFKDDLNTLEMGGFVVVSLSVSRRLWYGFELFSAIENLCDRRYVVGRAGIDTHGQPLLGRVGLRLR